MDPIYVAFTLSFVAIGLLPYFSDASAQKRYLNLLLNSMVDISSWMEANRGTVEAGKHVQQSKMDICKKEEKTKSLMMMEKAWYTYTFAQHTHTHIYTHTHLSYLPGELLFRSHYWCRRSKPANELVAKTAIVCQARWPTSDRNQIWVAKKTSCCRFLGLQRLTFSCSDVDSNNILCCISFSFFCQAGLQSRRPALFKVMLFLERIVKNESKTWNSFGLESV